jgi:hypothetical protein
MTYGRSYYREFPAATPPTKKEGVIKMENRMTQGVIVIDIALLLHARVFQVFFAFLDLPPRYNLRRAP